jgi:hypothetical protein
MHGQILMQRESCKLTVKKVNLTILGHCALEEEIENLKSAGDSSLLKY